MFGIHDSVFETAGTKKWLNYIALAGITKPEIHTKTMYTIMIISVHVVQSGERSGKRTFLNAVNTI